MHRWRLRAWTLHLKKRRVEIFSDALGKLTVDIKPGEAWMQTHGWAGDHVDVASIIADRFADGASPADVICGHEEIVRAIWSYISPLLGDGGIRAVLDRWVRVAAKDIPALQHVRVLVSAAPMHSVAGELLGAVATLTDLSTLGE